MGGLVMNNGSIIATVETMNEYIIRHNISDFRVKGMKEDTLYLVGGFDSACCHDIGITITGVCHLMINYNFYVDLSKQTPFSIDFPSEDTAIISFKDWSVQQRNQIHFDNDILFSTQHIPCSESGLDNHNVSLYEGLIW